MPDRMSDAISGVPDGTEHPLARTTTRLTPAVRALVAVVVVVGAALTAFAIWEAARLPIAPPRIASLAAIVLVGDISLLRLRFGSHGISYTWAEAALIVGVSLAGWPWFLAVGVPVVLVRQLVVRRALYKCAFNAASFAIAASAARAVAGPLTGHWVSPPASAGAVLALVPAAAVYFSVISVLVAMAVAWSQRRPLAAVWRRGLHLRLIMFAGNSAAGVGAALLGRADSELALAMPFFFLSLYAAYNLYLRAQQERDTWRDVHGATLDLNRVEHADVVAAVHRGAAALFDPDFVAVVDAGPDTSPELAAVAAEATGSTGPVHVDVSACTADCRRELLRRGLHSCTIAPLSGVGGQIGVLVLGFAGRVRLKPTELRMLATFASHVSVCLQHARLFHESGADRSRLAGIIDHASDGIFVIGADGNVLVWNPAIARATGVAPDAAVGASIDDVFAASATGGVPFRRDALLARLPEAAHDGRSATADVTVERADGKDRELALSISSVPAPLGEDGNVVVVARDVTAAREVEQAKQDFIATVSHELRTPLTPLKGYLSLLARGKYAPDAEARDDLYKELLDQAEQLERLVEDLLTVSRLQHGQFRVTLREADVDEVISRALSGHRFSSDRLVQRPNRQSAGHAVCDPARLQQVIANLVSNADKYSPARAPIVVDAEPAGDQVLIRVRDFGPGIPEESREAVFEAFHRLVPHVSATRGTGLGLHIARRLVEGMNGRIWVERADPCGAEFVVAIPAARPSAEPAPLEPVSVVA